MSLALVLAWLLGADAGVPPPMPAPAKAGARPEDGEVVRNLELLELMDETSDLELLEELSVER